MTQEAIAALIREEMRAYMHLHDPSDEEIADALRAVANLVESGNYVKRQNG